MKRLPLAILLASAALVAACSQSTSSNGTNSDTVRYTLKIDASDSTKRTELAQAAERVAKGVVSSMKENEKQITVTDASLDTKPADPVLTITLNDAQAVPTLTDVLTSGFTFHILAEHPDIATADQVVAAPDGTKKQGFKETGITETMLEGVTAGAMPGTQYGEVQLNFTPTGRDLLKQVYKQNQGKVIGIFVRNRLISTMKIETPEPKEDLRILNVPSQSLAKTFADDVNVGLHVTFAPETKK